MYLLNLDITILEHDNIIFSVVVKAVKMASTNHDCHPWELARILICFCDCWLISNTAFGIIGAVGSTEAREWHIRISGKSALLCPNSY